MIAGGAAGVWALRRHQKKKAEAERVKVKQATRRRELRAAKKQRSEESRIEQEQEEPVEPPVETSAAGLVPVPRKRNPMVKETKRVKTL